MTLNGLLVIGLLVEIVRALERAVFDPTQCNAMQPHEEAEMKFDSIRDH